jgi:hypothetical protein
MPQNPGSTFDCELTLQGPGVLQVPRELEDRLRAAGATRVAPVVAALPSAPELRGTDPVAVATLAVTSAGTLVMIIDTVRRWLADSRRGTAAPERAGQPEPPRVTSVTVLIDGDSLEIQEPLTSSEERLIQLFTERHTPRAAGPRAAEDA